MPAKPKKSASAQIKAATGNKTYSIGTSDEGVDLPLPSGQTCLARRPGVSGLMDAGILDSLDTLTGLVNEKHVKPNGTGPRGKVTVDPNAVQRLMEDTTQLKSVLSLLDRVTAFCVLQPSVSLPVPEGQERKPGVPVESVDLEDKMFILQWAVGGVNDLATFRRESKELLDGLEAG